MTGTALAGVIAVIFAASAFRAAFGFGEALLAVPLLALLIPVKVAAPLAVLASIVIAGLAVLMDWRHVHLRSVRSLILSTLFGLPLGLLLLRAVPAPAMKSALALLLLAFSGYSLFLPRHLSRRLILEDDRFAWAFGLAAGILGGSYGMNGPPLAIYGSLRGWPPERFRATLQGYFLPASVLGLCGYGFAGLLTAEVTRLSLCCAPAVLAGLFAGRRVHRGLDARGFARLLHFSLILVAILLLLQSKGLIG